RGPSPWLARWRTARPSRWSGAETAQRPSTRRESSTESTTSPPEAAPPWSFWKASDFRASSPWRSREPAQEIRRRQLEDAHHPRGGARAGAGHPRRSRECRGRAHRGDPALHLGGGGGGGPARKP